MIGVNKILKACESFAGCHINPHKQNNADGIMTAVVILHQTLINSQNNATIQQ